MEKDGITLEELSARTGVELRTLRSWISEGLLAPPYKSGRGATYPASNVERVFAVRALKEMHGMSFAEIGRRFMLASDEQIRDWGRPRERKAEAGSAREYLRSLRGGPGPFAAKAPGRTEPYTQTVAPSASAAEPPGPMLSVSAEGPLFSQPEPNDLARMERLIFELGRLLDGPAPRRARGTIWTRISVTPDLEISVRGDLDPIERDIFEQLADQLRAILTGRTKHD
jgi:DNA-binding transcriptional MerR regulator